MLIEQKCLLQEKSFRQNTSKKQDKQKFWLAAFRTRMLQLRVATGSPLRQINYGKPSKLLKSAGTAF